MKIYNLFEIVDNFLNERMINPRKAAIRYINITSCAVNFLPKISDEMIEKMGELEDVINKSWIYKKNLQKIKDNCHFIIDDIKDNGAKITTTKEWNKRYVGYYKDRINENKELVEKINFKKNQDVLDALGRNFTLKCEEKKPFEPIAK